MRLLSLEVSGFRGFATEQAFDLDADAVVVVGANGNGKTSLFDAILWALSGRVPRLGDDTTYLLSQYASSGEARVALELRRNQDSDPFLITRRFDGTDTRTTVKTSDGVVHGPEAEAIVMRFLWPEAAVAASPPDALADLLTRSVYLQQDLVRDFIDAATHQERFSAISELVGAGRVTDIQDELVREKKAWTTETNARSADLEPARSRLAMMESRLAELENRVSDGDKPADEKRWRNWLNQLQELGLSVSVIPMESRDAARAVDIAIKEVDATRRATERKQDLLSSLESELSQFAEIPKPHIGPLKERLEIGRRRVNETQQLVAMEQAREAELRRLQAEIREETEQLIALAGLALKHLGEKCPVCNQDYDVTSTKRRLKAVVAGAHEDQDSPRQNQKLSGLLSALAVQEQEMTAAEKALHTAEQAAREYEANEKSILRRLREVEIEAADTPGRISALRDLSATLKKKVDLLAEAARNGEALGLQIARAGDQGAIHELKQEIAVARTKLEKTEVELTRRAQSGEQAQSIIDALREASSNVVMEQVQSIEPLLSNIYRRIDVHPAFRAVRFMTAVFRGRGQLSTVISDRSVGVDCDAPGKVLSSSQVNALAVCTFLCLNLGVTHPPIEAMILDDPLQSLDDINLLGLVDLLRRTKDRRQLCVSTHDERFGQLLARKLRPRSPRQRTRVIELDGWDRRGPSVHTRDVQCDPEPLRLVASAR